MMNSFVMKFDNIHCSRLTNTYSDNDLNFDDFYSFFHNVYYNITVNQNSYSLQHTSEPIYISCSIRLVAWTADSSGSYIS